VRQGAPAHICIEVMAVVAAARKDPAQKKAMIDEAAKTEQELIDPLRALPLLAAQGNPRTSASCC
jgi:hypothetical protein